MSIESWEEEFYPIDASSETIEDDLTAIKHSIRKMEGLRPESLEKHGMKWNRDEYGLYEIVPKDMCDESMGAFVIDSDSCALCNLHEDCHGCPLFQARSGVRCDRRIPETETRSPWSLLVSSEYPEPMLEELHKALLFVLMRKSR
jgi:hypothetical protein